MSIKTSDYRTPGQFIKALLDEQGWTQKVLAAILGIDETIISNVLNDKKEVTASLALALEEVFDVQAEDFLELQRTYDLAKARIETIPDPDRATRAQLLGSLPIAAMIKRGWINANSIKDVPSVQSELMRFFGVERVEDIEILPHAAKKTVVSIEPTPTQLAWLYRVRQIAKGMIVPRYTKDKAVQAVDQLKLLLSAPEEVRKVPRILAEIGIRFVIVESLPSAKIDGVCFWLDDKSPVIAMTLRFDRIDNFWFVLRHELEHVIRGHGLSVDRRIMLDADVEGDCWESSSTDDEERVANAAAADFCVPTHLMDAFIARKAPLFAERDIIGFARTIKVHPGLIAGQIRRRTGAYNRFTDHLAKIRTLITPSAIVDGWGDVAPITN